MHLLHIFAQIFLLALKFESFVLWLCHCRAVELEELGNVANNLLTGFYQGLGRCFATFFVIGHECLWRLMPPILPKGSLSCRIS